MVSTRTWSGTRLKEIREREGLTQQSLSHLILTSVTNISRWENGVATPGADMAALIADGLGADLDEFYENGNGRAA